MGKNWNENFMVAKWVVSPQTVLRIYKAHIYCKNIFYFVCDWKYKLTLQVEMTGSECC